MKGGDLIRQPYAMDQRQFRFYRHADHMVAKAATGALEAIEGVGTVRISSAICGQSAGTEMVLMPFAVQIMSGTKVWETSVFDVGTVSSATGACMNPKNSALTSNSQATQSDRVRRATKLLSGVKYTGFHPDWIRSGI